MLSEPPSEVLLKEFNRHHVIPDDSRLKSIAKEVLLSVDETKMWFEHLSSVHENRKKGLQKAARARKVKTSQCKSKKLKAQGENQQAKQTGATESECCATCQKEEPSGFEDDSVNWICCDGCASWNHMICVGLSCDQVPQHWQCLGCVESWE